MHNDCMEFSLFKENERKRIMENFEIAEDIHVTFPNASKLEGVNAISIKIDSQYLTKYEFVVYAMKCENMSVFRLEVFKDGKIVNRVDYIPDVYNLIYIVTWFGNAHRAYEIMKSRN